MTGYERTIYTFSKQPKAQLGRIAITYRARLIGADCTSSASHEQ